MAESPWSILGRQVKQEVHHAGVHGQSLPPPRSPVSAAELKPDAESLGGIFPAGQQLVFLLCSFYRVVALLPFSQSLVHISCTVLPRRDFNPFLFVSNLH